jgi:hypothetical protein
MVEDARRHEGQCEGHRDGLRTELKGRDGKDGDIEQQQRLADPEPETT